LFNLACLHLAQLEDIKPSIVLTNDWYMGLAAAYRKARYFNDYFDNSKFLHIVHNLGDAYQGRIYVNNSCDVGHIRYLTGLNVDWLIDPYWNDKIFNPSRCAVICSDQWATVSKSYRKEIKQGCSLSPILNNFKEPFAFPNGVRVQDIKARLDKLGEYKDEKIRLLKKYFDVSHEDTKKYDELVLFGFVGRICEQKGVHLILESVEHILKVTNNNAYFVLGGMVDGSEYSAYCATLMKDLVRKYKDNFWANPDEFFTEGINLTKAADFFLMPSLFEPGGIVQHEALIAGTPVIAFSTGGLRDSIKEFNITTGEGNGFVFNEHNPMDFTAAVLRSLNVLKIPKAYKTISENCKTSFMDVGTVAQAWRGEFYRLISRVS